MQRILIDTGQPGKIDFVEPENCLYKRLKVIEKMKGKDQYPET